MNLLFTLASAHLQGRLRQTVVAGLGVALGVGFSVAMAALMQGSQEDFTRQLVEAMPSVEMSDEQRNPTLQPAEAQFASAEFHGLRPVEDRRGILNPTQVLATLRASVQGHIAPALRDQALARFSGRDAGVALLGIRPEDEAQVSSIAGDFTQGSFAVLNGGGYKAVIGDGLATKLGVSLGGSIELVASQGQRQRFTVAGLFHTGSVGRDEGEVYVLLKNAQILTGRADAINTIRIRIADPNAAQPLARQIEARFGFKAVSWQEANEAILQVLVVRNIIMYTVVAAILLVAGFGIFNVVSTITHEKARDIAILKSLGFRQRDMRRLFLMEGLAIGAGGSVMGWVVGYGLCLILASFRFDVRSVEHSFTRLPLSWSPLHYLLAAMIALFAAGIAGYFPARRAAALNPVDIIRGAT